METEHFTTMPPYSYTHVSDIGIYSYICVLVLLTTGATLLLYSRRRSSLSVSKASKASKAVALIQQTMKERCKKKSMCSEHVYQYMAWHQVYLGEPIYICI
jgi:hypothetical protein